MGGMEERTTQNPWSMILNLFTFVGVFHVSRDSKNSLQKDMKSLRSNEEQGQTALHVARDKKPTMCHGIWNIIQYKCWTTKQSENEITKLEENFVFSILIQAESLHFAALIIVVSILLLPKIFKMFYFEYDGGYTARYNFPKAFELYIKIE